IKINIWVEHRILSHAHVRKPNSQVQHQIFHFEVADTRQSRIRTATNIEVHPDTPIHLTHDNQCTFDETSMVTPRRPYEIKYLGFIAMVFKPASIPMSQAALSLRKLHQPK